MPELGAFERRLAGCGTTAPHFLGIAARVMWQILVDHARKRRAHKRGRPARAAQPVATLADPTGGLEMDVLALHEALDETLSNHKLDARIRAARWLHDVHGDGGGPCSSSAICIATSREQYAVPRVTALVNRLWTHD